MTRNGKDSPTKKAKSNIAPIRYVSAIPVKNKMLARTGPMQGVQPRDINAPSTKDFDGVKSVLKIFGMEGDTLFLINFGSETFPIITKPKKIIIRPAITNS